MEAFTELSSFLKENTLNSRRTLRSKVEKRGIGITQVFKTCKFFSSKISRKVNDSFTKQDFLGSVASVRNSLDYVYNSASKVNETVDGMINLLEQTKTKTSHLRNRMNKLQADG